MLRVVAPLLLMLCCGESLPEDVVEWGPSIGTGLEDSVALSANWAVLGERCFSQSFQTVLSSISSRRLAVARGEMADALGLSADVGCPVLTCLNKGTRVSMLSAASNLHRYVQRDDASETSFQRWYAQVCNEVEVGFLTYGDNLKLWWIDPDTDQRVFKADLVSGERKTHWCTSILGHEFEATDEDGQVIKRLVVEHNGIYVIVPSTQPSSSDSESVWAHRVESTEQREEERANRVKRTFTKHGFEKRSVPEPTYADMLSYWTNNGNQRAYEELNVGGAYINWWVSAPEMVYVPAGLKARWHAAIQRVVANWIGEEPDFLEATDLYGMRVYRNQSVLARHVDRESTHAVSAIVNVDQLGMRRDWPVSIYDLHEKRMVEVVLKPGELLLYESARCLHERHEPMDGVAYVNLFVHYRPMGDPKWYLHGTNEAYDDGKASGVVADGNKRNWRDKARHLTRNASAPIPAPAIVSSRTHDRMASLGTKMRQRQQRMGTLAHSEDSAQPKSHVKYVHPHKLRRRWRKVLDNVGLWMLCGLGAAVGLLCCAIIARRLTRRKGRRAARKLRRESGGRPPTGSASPTQANSRIRSLPNSIRQAARSNRGAAAVERWLASSRRAANARDVEPPRRALLHHAAAHGAAAVARVVVAAGADPDLLDDAGDSPLHLAAFAGSGALVKILLEAGANPLATDATGRTPLDRAREANNTGCALLISKHIQVIRVRQASSAANGDTTHRDGVSLRRLSSLHADDAV